MRVVIVGYGKMGRAIENLLDKQKHEISGIIASNTPHDVAFKLLKEADVAIEFTGPESAHQNVKLCLAHKIPVVCGSTGWFKDFNAVENEVNANNGCLFYASNFSIGVNILFEINNSLARIMSQFPSYNTHITEIHHLQKKDAPSGTAITLAEGIMLNNSEKSNWKLGHQDSKNIITIEAERKDRVFGIHEVSYNSNIDKLSISHEAHTRDGFANGAIMAAEWVIGQKGVFGMSDMLKF